MRGLPPDRTADAARALVRGGLAVLEVTLNSAEPFRVLEALRGSSPDAMIGAGTVLTGEEALQAIEHGAQFLVSPIVESEVIEVARRKGIPAIPGAATPTEIVRAWRLGADIVKVFPAGGPQQLALLRGPLDKIPLMPTGGVTSQNAAEYIRAGAAAVGVGISVVNSDLLNANDLDEIERRAREIRTAVDMERSRTTGA